MTTEELEKIVSRHEMQRLELKTGMCHREHARQGGSRFRLGLSHRGPARIARERRLPSRLRFPARHPAAHLRRFGRHLQSRSAPVRYADGAAVEPHARLASAQPSHRPGPLRHGCH